MKKEEIGLYLKNNPNTKHTKFSNNTLKKGVINYTKQLLKNNNEVTIKVPNIAYMNKKVYAVVTITGNNGAVHSYIDCLDPIKLLNY